MDDTYLSEIHIFWDRKIESLHKFQFWAMCKLKWPQIVSTLQYFDIQK